MGDSQATIKAQGIIAKLPLSKRKVLTRTTTTSTPMKIRSTYRTTIFHGLIFFIYPIPYQKNIKISYSRE
jgi:hypothetical protein